MTSWNTDALVLETFPLGESDQLVSFLTPAQGKLVAVAKGALRSKERFAGMFDLFQQVRAGFMIAPRSGRVMVEHAALANGFPAFRKSPARLARASLLIEIVSVAAAEHQPSPGLFELLLSGLKSLHAAPDTDRWAAAYAFKMLAELGYRPALSECVCCRGPGRGTRVKNGGKGFVFSPSAGGVLCAACAGKELAESPHEAGRGRTEQRVEISMDTIKTLCALMDSDLDMTGRIGFTRNALEQAGMILGPFIAWRLERPSRALEFMGKMAA